MQTVQFSHCFAVESSLGDYSFVWSFPLTVSWLCAFGRTLCFTPSSLSSSMVNVSWLCAFGRVLCFRPSSLSTSLVQHLHPRQWNPAGCVAFCVSWCCLEFESKLWTIACNNFVIRNWTTCSLETGQHDFLVVRVQEHFVVHYRDEDAAWRQETDARPGWKLAVSIPCGHAVLPW